MAIAIQTNVKFKDLITEFNQIKADAFSGNLVIQVEHVPSWMLCFSSGRLAGISGGIDAIDRWQRNLALASLNAALDRLIKSNNDREIFLNSNKLAQECVFKEVLFDIIQFSQNQGDRLFYQLISVNRDRNAQLKSVLPLLEIKPMIGQTIQEWQEWERHELASYAPSLFPIVQKSAQIADFDEDRNLQYLIASIDGTKSLRSLAIYHQKRSIDIVETLLPLLTLGIITLSLVKSTAQQNDRVDSNIASVELDRVKIARPDRSNLGITSNFEKQNIDKPSHLIACIDDSIFVYKNLEKIITANGYRSFGVQDPLKIIPSLIRNKPDLIFLDLVMPVTNGYEVCEQIRKTPSLTDIPVIILTGSDGLIDRVRTKFVGANGFLGKPIQAEAIVKTIDKYLNKRKSIKTISHSKSQQILIPVSQISRRDRLDRLDRITKRVAIVIDDRNIRQVVSMCLHKLKGWDVLTAASGREGLDSICFNHPDAIVLDLMMPDMDGLAFLRHLRSSTTKIIPVIILAASSQLPDRHLLAELGVVEIVSKPFLPIDLVRQIDRALEGRISLV
jgi:two-component system, chemotaxis family, response regulator PixG